MNFRRGSIVIVIILVVLVVVIAGAYLFRTQKTTPLWEIQPESTGATITTKPQPSATPDPTVSWKTYRNEKYGFEFKYPNQYFIKESPEIITLDDGSNDNTITAKKPITIEKIEIPQSETYKEFLIKNTIFNASGKNPSSFDNFTEQRIGQNTFYHIDTGRFEGVLSSTYYLVEDIFTYKFNVVSYIGAKRQDPNFKETDDIHYQNLNQLLSTFRFLE